MAKAALHVNKLSAAKRQLQAAIRMYFQSEDELAVHTIAAAAYGLLKDIKKSRGMSEAADTYLVSVFYIVRDYRRGNLPEEMTRDSDFMTEIERLAEKLSSITAESRLSDVQASIGPELERQYWNDTNRAANFLKHADRDPEQAMPLDVIDNVLLLGKAVSSYQDVAPDDLGNEGLVFAAFLAAANDSYQLGEGSFSSVVASMRKVPVERRIELSYELITKMNIE
ncbi:hypothetical protein Q7C_1475 [Methylophaga frappieri]|uniref:Uncharacterized protein n=1 Tax=Methylophaga frappieri (strain ATCC BAA-2434 / DSM 25690 / JAM7) TaxID=754477 RepID=I1YI81_METFJ|nr:hypothetical protein [Methylophaga frappieri]AFJ02624.1 hypothetical protein Q7C_1475 [Methylophaga frappieri]